MEFFNFSGAPPLLTPPTLPPQTDKWRLQQELGEGPRILIALKTAFAATGLSATLHDGSFVLSLHFQNLYS